MEFVDTVVVASTQKLGLAQLNIAAGKSLKIKTSGTEVLDIEVPAGKSWYVELSVLITETGA